MLIPTLCTGDYDMIRKVITDPWETDAPPLNHTLVLKESRACIKVSRGLGPFGGYGNIKVVIPFSPEIRRHIDVFNGEKEHLETFAFDMYLPHVEHVGDDLKIRFSTEMLDNPEFIDNVLELIDKVVCVLR
jgi:hypothetical protein